MLEPQRPQVTHAFEEVWNLAATAQDHHRRAAGLRDPGHAEILRATHARITAAVEELERAAVDLHRVHASSDLDRPVQAVDDLTLTLRSTASAVTEVNHLS